MKGGGGSVKSVATGSVVCKRTNDVVKGSTKTGKHTLLFYLLILLVHSAICFGGVAVCLGNKRTCLHGVHFTNLEQGHSGAPFSPLASGRHVLGRRALH